MHKSLIVLDNFYDNPIQVRQFAFSMGFRKPPYETGYPGYETPSLDEKQLKQIASKLGEVVNSRLAWPSSKPQGVFRITTPKDEEERKNLVHIDPCSWTAVVYLSLPQHCLGGTSFYRHKETGLHSYFPEINPEVQDALRERETDYASLQKIIFKDTLDLSKWEETERVSMRFNRAILFRGGRFHGVPTLFGDSLENGRLVQTFFFYEVESVDSEGNIKIPAY